MTERQPASTATSTVDSTESHEVDSDPSSGPASVRKMLLSASATAVLLGASNGFGFVVALLLARFLGGQGYGLYAVSFAWASLLMTVATLGLDRFLIRGLAVYRTHEQWQLMKGLLRRTNQLVVLTSILVALCGMAVAVAWLVPSLRGPFCVAMVLVPITSLTLLRQGAMQAIGRVVSGQIPEYLIRPVLIIGGIVTLQLVGHGALTPTTALGVNVAAVTIAFVVGAVLLNRALPPVLHSIRPKFVTGEWLRASLPMMLISGVLLANGNATTLLVGALDGAQAAGVYNVVQKGAEVVVLVQFATNMPLAPAVARLHALEDRRGLEHATEHMARATLMLSAPIAAAFIAFPRIYLNIFGAEFRTGAAALIILALGQLFNAATGPSGTVLIMTGHERSAVRGVAAGLVVNIVLAIVLVPPLGVAGGAIAFAFSLIVLNSVLVVLGRRRIGVNVTAFSRLSLQNRHS